MAHVQNSNSVKDGLKSPWEKWFKSLRKIRSSSRPTGQAFAYIVHFKYAVYKKTSSVFK